MNAFIDQLIEEIKLLPVKDTGRVQVIFPSRRACAIFKNKFKNHFDKPVFLPAVCSIEDFILSHSDFTLADDAVLMLELFAVYQSIYQSASFDEFYNWGKILLNDFDELDSNLVNHTRLFATFQNIADIENMFDLDDEQKKWMTEFWLSLFGQHGHDENDIRQQFKNNWQHLPYIYEQFRQRLLNRKLVYRGLAYRLIAEKVELHSLKLAYDHFVFAGLYALSKSEEKIVDQLLLMRKASVYWDTDDYYVKNVLHEAGEYIRSNPLITDNYKWNSNHFEQHEKQLTIYSAVQNIAQAKQTGLLIEELISNNKLNISETAIVLPDEQLLLPVLNSLPSSLTDINITMGYPVKQTALYSFLKSFLDLIQSAKLQKNHLLFSKFYFRQWLQHSFVKNYFEEKFEDFENAFENRFAGYVSIQTLLKDYNDVVFSIMANGKQQLLEKVKTVLQIFIDFNAQSLNKIETEAGKFFLKSILQLQLVTEPYHEELSADFEMALLRDAIKNLRIPFTGEPVKGLQIMGFLETRLLDFETLFILSVNEGFLPAQSARQSYIPYALRKAFGMQTSEHQDSISAYHFYRLLQRAGDVTLFYNAHAGKTGGGEPSRFIMQMDYELKSYSNIHIAHKNIQIPVVNYGAKDIVIEKKDDVAAALEKLKHNGEENGFAFSPTSVLTYLTCPLKFYLRYVARIKETESAEDKIEGALFGKILHRAMELLYSDLKTIDTATVTKLISEAEEKVIQSMHENFPQSAFGLEGKNILMKNILVDLAKRILKHDAAATPFTIEAVEFKAITEFKIDKSITVKIQGVIDRLESSKNYWRIVDYKTGKMEKLPEEGLMEKIFDGPKLKEAFQLYMYGWLLNRIDHTKTIQASFFELRKITSGMANLTENGFTESDYRMFEDHLKLKLLELFDSNTPFVQTDDANRCIYCPYTGICNR